MPFSAVEKSVKKELAVYERIAGRTLGGFSKNDCAETCDSYCRSAVKRGRQERFAKMKNGIVPRKKRRISAAKRKGRSFMKRRNRAKGEALRNF